MVKSLYIIIVTWNGQKFIEDCLNSLRRQNASGYGVIVVDNNSSDRTCQIISEEYSGVILIRNKENRGFAAANNQGIDRAFSLGARYIVLLNQDTEVDPNFVTAGIEYFENHLVVGLASPIIYYPGEQRIWFAGTKIFRGPSILAHPTAKLGFHVHKKKILTADDRHNPVDWVPGCALFVRRSVVERIGRLDESYFMYGEDVDFSLRARKAGIKLGLVEGTIVIHKENISQKIRLNRALFKKIGFMVKSRYKNINRYYSPAEKVYYLVKLIYTPFFQLYYAVRKMFS